MIALVRTLLNFDHLYLGGGNAANIALDIAARRDHRFQRAGITGGVRLWEPRFDEIFAGRRG